MYLCTALLILAVVVISIVVYKNPNTDTAGFGYAPMFMPTDVEKSRDGEEYIYTFTVPEAMKNYGTMYLTFYMKHAYSKVSIPGTGAGPWEYSLTDSFHIGKTPGNYWQSVPIIPDFSQEKVIVEIEPVYGNLTAEPQFMIVERFMSMYIRMHDDLPVLIFSSIALIIGVFQAVIALLTPYAKRVKERLFYLGALTAAAGLWKLMGVPVLTLIFSELAQTFYYIGICSYFLIPFLAVRYIACSKDSGDKRINILLSYLTALSAGLFFMLQLFGIFELYYALPFMAALNIFVPLTASISFPFKLRDLWGYLIALASIADSIMYFTRKSAADSVFLL